MKKILPTLFAITLLCVAGKSNAQCIIARTITGGPTSVCVGPSEYYYYANSGMSNYQWGITGGTIVSQGASWASVQWSTSGSKTLSVNFLDTNGCTSSLPTILNITVNPLPIPTITGNATACQGSTGNVYTTEPGKTDYSWPNPFSLSIFGGGTITAGGTSTDNSMTVTWDNYGGTEINVGYTDANGCTGRSAQKSITLLQSPIRTISGNSTSCIGSTSVYSTETGMSGYTWTVTGGAIVSGSSTNTASIAWSQAGIQTISVFYTVPSGCPASPTPTTKTINVLPMPIATISGNATACVDVGQVYYTESGKTNYIWTLPAGGTLLSGGYNAYINWGTTGAKTFSVTYTDSNGCTSTSATKTVSVVASTPTITGNFNICSGINAIQTYTTQPGMTYYRWLPVNGGTVLSGGTLTDNTVTIQWTAYGQPSYLNLSYVTPNGCFGYIEQPVDNRITYVPTINGTSTVCQGTSNYFGINSVTGGSYTWAASPDGTVISGGTTADSYIYLSWNTPGTKTVSLTANVPGACAAPVSMSVTVLPSNTATITGPTTVCETIGYSYTTEAGKTNYNWTIPYGTIISGQGTNSVTVAWIYGTGNQTIGVSYSNANGCTPTVQKTVFVNPKPVISLTGSTAACQNSPSVYTTDPGMSNYVWTIPPGASVIAGGTSTSNTITLQWSSPGNGVLYVNYNNSSGCALAVPAGISIGIYTTPVPTITGSPACLNKTTTYYTESGKTGYTWTIGGGGTVMAGGGPTDYSIDVKWTAVGPKTVSVNYTAAYGGCTAASPTVINFTVHNQTIPVIAGYQSLCLNGSSWYTTDNTGMDYFWHVDYVNYAPSSDYMQAAQFLTSGSHFVAVSYTDSYGCLSAYTSLPITVSQYAWNTSQALTASSLINKNVGDVPFNPGTTSNRFLPVAYSSSNNAVATVSGNTVTIVGIGTCTITSSQPGDGCVTAAPNAFTTLYVNKGNQTITFGALSPITFGAATPTLPQFASSGLGITYTSSNTSVATVSGNTVTIIGAGTTNITASQAGNTNYNAAANVVQPLIVNAAGQTISFGSIATKTYGDAPFTLTGTASSGLAVIYSSSDPTVATITGNIVTITGAGTCIITASQPGNANYTAAANVTQNLTVNKANQTITFNALSAKTYADTPFFSGAIASSSLPISLTSSNTSVATVSSNTITIVGVGNTIITASQPGNSNFNPAAISITQSLTVNKKTPTVSITSANSGMVGGSITLTTDTGGSTGAVSYTVSNGTGSAYITGNILYLTSGGTVTVTANVAADGNFNVASATQVVTINRSGQLISFGPLSMICGSGSITLTASSTSGLPISYLSSNTSVITISGNVASPVGNGSATITASQPGNGFYYAAADVSQGILVGSSSGGSISTSPSANICTTGGATLTAPSGSNYSWNTGETSASIFVTDTGTYTVSYTNSTGCPVTTSRTITRTGTNCHNFRIAQDVPSQTDDPAITSQPDAIHPFGISPNPANQKVLIVLSSPALQDSPIEIIDMLGRLRKSSTIEKNSIEKSIAIDDMESGIYIVNVKDGKRYRQRQLVIIR